MDFFGNHKDLAKVSRLLDEFFTIRRLVWIFLWIFGCFESVFGLELLLFINLTNDILSKTTVPLEAYLYHRVVSCAPKNSIG
jgi:hypothetical protein